MKIQLLAFGIAKDILNTSTLTLDIPEKSSVELLRAILVEKHPKISGIQSFAIAVNEEYAKDETILQENDVVAIIPPVSGG